MKVLQLIITLSLFFLMYGCSSETIPPSDRGNEDPVTEIKAVDFENPTPGQETMFLRYESTCDSLNESFHYTGDTLKLAVVEEDGILYFEESLTAGSPMFIDSAFREPIKQRLIDEAGRILIPERLESPLFYFYGNDTLHLQPEQKMPLYRVGCRFFHSQGPFIGNDIGKVDSLAFGDIEFGEKTVVSCVPSFFQVEAYLIYSENELFMSHTISWGSVVQGWTKLEGS